MMQTSQVRRAAFGLGSNTGDRLAHLQGAVDRIFSEPGIEPAGVSKVYETAPVGGPVQPDFLNAVVVVDTMLTPADLLELAHRCESAAARERNERWGPRTLDVDVLALGDVISDEPKLTLPHPRIDQRAFVLRPWADVDPVFVVRDGATVQDLLALVDTAGIREADQQLRVAA
jgi:2-amino-4-hydroxy-6-hydroxymethyldihydropteridine diphosphokinase